jgi:hypothetical protein
MWNCPKCGAKVEPTYEVCWRCGTSREGVEDPDFVTADEAGPIESPPLLPGSQPALDLEEGPAAEVAGPGTADLVECYLARDVLQARDLAEQLNGLGIPAVADTEDIRLRGAGAAVTNYAALGNPYFGPRVWVRREDLARARSWLEANERGKKAGESGWDLHEESL